MDLFLYDRDLRHERVNFDATYSILFTVIQLCSFLLFLLYLFTEN